MSSSPGVIDRHTNSASWIRKGVQGHGRNVSAVRRNPRPPLAQRWAAPFRWESICGFPASWATEIPFHVDVRDVYRRPPVLWQRGLKITARAWALLLWRSGISHSSQSMSYLRCSRIDFFGRATSLEAPRSILYTPCVLSGLISHRNRVNGALLGKAVREPSHC
jgi:hypothetical protein